MAGAWTFRLCFLYVCFALANAHDRHSNLQDIVRQYIQQAIQSQSTGNNRFVGPELSAIYCAYCREKGWTNCINRFCFRRIIPPSFPRNIYSPTRSFGLHGNNANAHGRHSNLQDIVRQYIQQAIQSQSTGNNRFAGSELAAIYCAYCRQKGWTECINLYCYQRPSIPPRFPGNIVSATRSFSFHGNNAIAAGGFGFRRRQETYGSS